MRDQLGQLVAERLFGKLNSLIESLLDALALLPVKFGIELLQIPAERKLPCAPKLSAAWESCSGVSVLRTPNQLIASRTAAVRVRNRCAG